MNRIFGFPPIVYILSFGIFMWLAWPPFNTNFIVFFGLIPLLILTKKSITENYKKGKYFSQIYLANIIWNTLTTWWIYNASPEGGIFAIIYNSFVLSIPWVLYRFSFKKTNEFIASFFLIVSFISIEYLHYHWKLTWPWLTLGNAFASTPSWVQWYSFTGALGGSVWVILVNILLFNFFQNFERTILLQSKKTFVKLSLVIFIPILFSLFLYFNKETKFTKEIEVCIVQPNIDPYNEKFDSENFDNQIEKMVSLAKSKMTDKTSIILFPETAISQPLNESDINTSNAIFNLKKLTEKNAVILTGADTYHVFESDEELSPTARLSLNDVYYDSYNTALLLDKTNNFQVFHKNKLVPGVEYIPYPKMFKPLEKLFELEGTVGSLGSDNNPVVFKTPDSVSIMPVVCYESIYGDWVRQGMNDNEGELIAIISNDAWWGNTDGYKQLLQYARLRAIENNKYVIRSGNTGISAFIDNKGKVYEQSKWWTAAALTNKVKLNDEKTFYMKHGDYLGKISLALMLLTYFSILGKSLFVKKLK